MADKGYQKLFTEIRKQTFFAKLSILSCKPNDVFSFIRLARNGDSLIIHKTMLKMFLKYSRWNMFEIDNSPEFFNIIEHLGFERINPPSEPLRSGERQYASALFLEVFQKSQANCIEILNAIIHIENLFGRPQRISVSLPNLANTPPMYQAVKSSYDEMKKKKREMNRIAHLSKFENSLRVSKSLCDLQSSEDVGSAAQRDERRSGSHIGHTSYNTKSAGHEMYQHLSHLTGADFFGNLASTSKGLSPTFFGKKSECGIGSEHEMKTIKKSSLNPQDERIKEILLGRPKVSNQKDQQLNVLRDEKWREPKEVSPAGEQRRSKSSSRGALPKSPSASSPEATPRKSRTGRHQRRGRHQIEPEDLTPPMPMASLPPDEQQRVQDLLDGEVFECGNGDPMTEYFKLLQKIDFKGHSGAGKPN